MSAAGERAIPSALCDMQGPYAPQDRHRTTYSALDQSGGLQCIVDDRTDVRKGRRRLLLPYRLVILVEYFTLQHGLGPFDLMGRRRKLHDVSIDGGASKR